MIPHEKRRAQRPSRIPCCRLDPDVLIEPFTQELTVSDAIECYSAGKDQVFHFRLPVHSAADAQQHIIRHRLDAGRQVHVSLLQVRFRRPGRTAEEPVETAARHRKALAVVEVLHIQAEAAILLEVHQVLENGLLVHRLAVRRQAHELVFAAIDLETAVVCEAGIEQTERMRKGKMAQQLDAVAFADAVAGRGPLTYAIERKNCRPGKRARKECGGSMALGRCCRRDSPG